MRAAKLTAPGRIEVVQAEKPKIAHENEVLVQIKAVGICGTDIHIFKGERADVSLPRVMGHELSGIVEETGEGVTRLKCGDRVVLDPVFACNSCEVCRKGHENVCEHVSCFGVQMEGGFQDYIVVEEKHLYPYSPQVTFEEAALAEPFSIAANILSRTGLSEGEQVVILGSGTIGICILTAAKGMGAKVLIADVVEEKLETARKAGADVIVNTKEKSLEEEVEKFSTGGAHVVIDAVGIAALTEQTPALAAPTGRIAVIGFDTSPAQISPSAITRKELTIVGSRMNCHQFPKVMEWLEQGKIDKNLLISRTYPLEQIQQAFEETISCSREIVKTMIQF